MKGISFTSFRESLYSIQDTLDDLTQDNKVMNEEAYINISYNTRNIYNRYVRVEHFHRCSEKRLLESQKVNSDYEQKIQNKNKEIQLMEEKQEILDHQKQIQEKFIELLLEENKSQAKLLLEKKVETDTLENDLCTSLMFQYNSLKRKRI